MLGSSHSLCLFFAGLCSLERSEAAQESASLSAMLHSLTKHSLLQHWPAPALLEVHAQRACQTPRASGCFDLIVHIVQHIEDYYILHRTPRDWKPVRRAGQLGCKEQAGCCCVARTEVQLHKTGCCCAAQSSACSPQGGCCNVARSGIKQAGCSSVPETTIKQCSVPQSEHGRLPVCSSAESMPLQPKQTVATPAVQLTIMLSTH